MERATTITLRVEKDLKNNFYQLCEEFGLSASTAFNIFMKAVVRERKIPFEIQSKKSAVNLKALQAFEEMRETAQKAGAGDMTLEEINAEIKAARDEINK